MLPLLTSEQMRALDAHAIDTIGIPGLILMENAARSVLEAIEEEFDDVEFLTAAVVCGPGNNGGDGFALARQLHLRGCDVDVFLAGEPAQLQGDALANFKLLAPLGLNVIGWQTEPEGISLDEYDLIVDAVFGTGKVRAAEGVIRDALEAINDAPGFVVAIDVPSGVDASTGEVSGAAVRADMTVTFQCAKCGLLLPPGRDYAGDVVVAPISIPEQDEVLTDALFGLPEDDDVLDLLPARPRDAHKGDFGKLLIIAGSRGMSGAARLAAMAALRAGVGLVKVAAPESVRSEIAAFRPEIMTIGLPETPAGTIAASAHEILVEHLQWADAVAVGPGLGCDADTARFLERLLPAVAQPLIIDADALNLIAENKLIDSLPAETVITPHPIEFDRLADEQHATFAVRIAAAANLAERREINVVLKGSPTICFDSTGFGMINPTGNVGLATAGSGDVLTGIIAALRAQGLDAYSAAWVGTFLHGRAADLAVDDLGTASLVAGDVITYLPAAFASLEPEREANAGHSGCCCHGRGA